MRTPATHWELGGAPRATPSAAATAPPPPPLAHLLARPWPAAATCLISCPAFMAGVRLRTRRRQLSWIRIAAVAALALLGGAAVWSGLSTSEAHAARQKQPGGAAQVGTVAAQHGLEEQ